MSLLLHDSRAERGRTRIWVNLGVIVVKSYSGLWGNVQRPHMIEDNIFRSIFTGPGLCYVTYNLGSIDGFFLKVSVQCYCGSLVSIFGFLNQHKLTNQLSFTFNSEYD